MLTVILVLISIVFSIALTIGQLGRILAQFQDIAAKRIERLCNEGKGIVLHNVRTWGENPQMIDPYKFTQMFSDGWTFQCTSDEGDFVIVHGLPDGSVQVQLPGTEKWIAKVDSPDFYTVTTPGNFLLISCYPDSRKDVVIVPFRTFVQPLKGKYSLRFVWKGNDLWIAPNNKLTEILQIMEKGYREAQERKMQKVLDQMIQKHLKF